MSPRPIEHKYCEGNVLIPWSGDNGETGRRNRVGLKQQCWSSYDSNVVRRLSSDASRLETRTEECHAQASLCMVKCMGAGKPIPRLVGSSCIKL